MLDPSDGSVIQTLESASPHDGIAAVDAAAGAAEAWASRAPRERAEILRNAYELMTERLDEIAEAIVREMGKPFVEARGEAGYAAEFLRWFSEEAVRVERRVRRRPRRHQPHARRRTRRSASRC